MEKVIEIDLLNKKDTFEKYDKNIISKDLVNYLINTTPKLKKNDSLKLIINNEIKIDNCIELITKRLEHEYSKTSLKHELNNYTQFFYLIIGVTILYLSSLVDIKIVEEFILIIGWVFIWDLVETEIVTDMNNRKRRRIIKWLLNSKIIEKK